MTKKSQIQAWLNGFYMENLYGQRMTSKHVHARWRPGVPAPVMIKRKPILHHPWRSEQYGAVVSMCIPRYDFAKILFCHNIILPRYDFAKISFCQILILPQYHFAKVTFCQSILFPVEPSFSQAWIWDFLVMKTMSVDLSIGLCCVISVRVIVRKCCGLRLAVPLPNKHNYPNCRTDTQYQPEKKTHRWHLFYLIDFINLKQ